MKNIARVLAVCAAFVLAVQAQGFATDATPVGADIKATVDSVLDFTIGMRESTGDDANGNPIWVPGEDPHATTMNFGTLIRSTNLAGQQNALRSLTSWHVYINVNTSQSSYTVKYNQPVMKCGTIELPNALSMTPVNAVATDNLGNDVDVSSGFVDGTTSRSGITTGATTLFNSVAPNHYAAELELVYGISGGNTDPADLPFTGWQAISSSQAAGEYQSRVTFTCTV